MSNKTRGLIEQLRNLPHMLRTCLHESVVWWPVNLQHHFHVKHDRLPVQIEMIKFEASVHSLFAFMMPTTIEVGPISWSARTASPGPKFLVVVAPQPMRILSHIVRAFVSPLPRAIAPKELVLYGLRLGVELLHIM